MEARGVYEPETVAAAREAYAAVGPVAQRVVTETAKAMGFSAEEYDERVTAEVVETARDALFASLLRTYSGSRADFETWCERHPSYTVDGIGSDDVECVVFHPVGPAETVLAASYQHEREAATATVRRVAFGRYYRERF